ncbi:histone H2A-Bbd type 1 [Tupaia chinensis]|uniref:Histone H2A n=1 Tax=Tupaia chinensis TaxID=246437 RepID=L8Y1P1_TUPCH|nr:histone H2A-Bbd type 1 [Tupaia chinensis]ELV10278.1 Histone H2A, embryonic [Tupaia chinensis]
MAGKKRSGGFYRRRRRAITRSRRAELQFPVSRVDRFLREGQYAKRLSSSTPVFLAGVLEYLTANILDLAGKEAHNNHRKRITPEHVEKAVDNNIQLSCLFEDVANSRVDKMPHPKKN